MQQLVEKAPAPLLCHIHSGIYYAFVHLTQPCKGVSAGPQTPLTHLDTHLDITPGHREKVVRLRHFGAMRTPTRQKHFGPPERENGWKCKERTRRSDREREADDRDSSCTPG